MGETESKRAEVTKDTTLMAVVQGLNDSQPAASTKPIVPPSRILAAAPGPSKRGLPSLLALAGCSLELTPLVFPSVPPLSSPSLSGSVWKNRNRFRLSSSHLILPSHYAGRPMSSRHLRRRTSCRAHPQTSALPPCYGAPPWIYRGSSPRSGERTRPWELRARAGPTSGTYRSVASFPKTTARRRRPSG